MLETARPDPLSLDDIPNSSSQLHIIMIRLKRLLDQEIAATLRQFENLKVAEWRILYMLAHEGPMPQKDLSRRTVVQQSHASRALKAMTQRGLVVAQRDESDRRQWLFALTDKGRQLFDRVDPVMQARRGRIDGTLSDHELDSLRDMATRVAHDTYAVLEGQQSGLSD